MNNPNKEPLSKIRNQSLALNYAPIAKRNLLKLQKKYNSEIQIPLIDIYVNDYCNAHCPICPSPRGINSLPISSVEKLVQLQPYVLTLTGGGEPSIYRFGFDTFIRKIRNNIGNLPLGVMTNGIRRINEYVINNLDWLRVSMNASAPETYASAYGVEHFRDVQNNIIKYTKGEVEKVGIGFVITPDNFREICNMARVIVDEILPRLTEKAKNKINLQYRPMAYPDYSRFHLSQDKMDKIMLDFTNLNDQAKLFLLEHSNFAQLLENSCFQEVAKFKRCMISLLQMNLDADGQVYSCPQKAHHKKNSYGNLMDLDFFKNLPERLEFQLENFNSDTCPYCAQGRVNELFDNLDFDSINEEAKMEIVFF